MKKKRYLSPQMLMVGICGTTILEGSTETLPFDPGDGTDESLSKKSDWDDLWDN